MPNKVVGQCCICGKIGKLTKEHVPPHKAFNNFKNFGLDGDDFINALQDKEFKTKINQNGSADYTLCAECNNNTGTWYANDYIEFVHYIHYFCKDRPEKSNCLSLTAKQINFGNVIKQIFTMFASSLKYDCVKKLGIDTYLLEKDNFNIDTSKFKLYCYVNFDYMIEKTGILCACKIGRPTTTFASLKTYPLGFILNLNPEIEDDAWTTMLDLEDVIKAGNNFLTSIQLNIPIINDYQPAFNTKALINNIQKKFK